MKRLSVLLVAAGLCLGLSGCGGDGAPKEKVFLEESEIAGLYASPKDYKGKYVEVTGKVFGTVDEKDGQIAFQIWADPENSDKNTVIGGAAVEGGLASSDYVKVVGYVDGEFNGTNAFGGSVTAPQLVAESIEKVDYVTAVSPTIKEITPNAVVEQNGVSVTVEKVEFSKKETRVYFKIVNNSQDKFNFYSFNTKITQNGKQFEEKSNYDADYEEPASEILPGITSSGIIAFPVLEQTNFTIINEAHSDNYSVDFEPYTFHIEVK